MRLQMTDAVKAAAANNGVQSRDMCHSTVWAYRLPVTVMHPMWRRSNNACHV